MSWQNERILNQGEQANRIALGKSIVTAFDLPKGKIIEEHDLTAKSPRRGFLLYTLANLLEKNLSEIFPRKSSFNLKMSMNLAMTKTLLT